MKLNKNILKQLVREAIEDPSMMGTRMDSREVYGDEEAYEEGEEEENEVVRQLESIITDLMSVKRKLEDAQGKEGLKESVGAVSYKDAVGALAGCREMIQRGQKQLALDNLYVLEKYIMQ